MIIQRRIDMTRERLWPLALFLVLVLPLSWYGFLIRGSSATDSGLNPLGPLVAALIVCAVSGQFREFLKRIIRVRTAPSTYAIALLLPALLCLTGVAAGALATDTPFPFAQAASRSVEFVDAFLIALLFVALGEEPGWRGYLLPALTSRVGPVVATLAICPIWAIWHYPLIGPQLPLDLLPQFLVSLVGGAFVLSWLTLRANGGVLPAMLCHGMINGIGANYLYRLFEGEALTIIWWTNSLLWLAAGAYAAFAMQRAYRAASPANPIEAEISQAMT
jgi:membrane protease YdiL (CAAX protease family)